MKRRATRARSRGGRSDRTIPVADARARVGGRCYRAAMTVEMVQPGAESGARPRPRRNDIPRGGIRSEEHTSELQSLMRISYAVFCLKKKINIIQTSNKLSTSCDDNMIIKNHTYKL